MEIFIRVPSFASGSIKNMNQNLASFYMAKKLIPKTSAFTGAFY